MRITANAEIQPFTIDIPQSALDELRTRLEHTRWPAQTPGVGWERGVPLDYIHELARYWHSGYDWRTHEAELNTWPQFTTEIDGTTIHFLHVRSPEPQALPLILTHGWPGSVAEFLDVIGPLTDPAAHGGAASDAFHVVIPSLPGFGFSGATSEPGWDSHRIAKAFAELMSRLGYGRYAAQGGDFGAFVAPDLGRVDAEHIVGVHVNAATIGFIPVGDLDDAALAELTDTEKARVTRLGTFMSEGNGYFQIQATRPQTLGYALADSPVGQLAWIMDKFKEWTHPATELPEKSIDRDRMLTNVMLYWLTDTGGSAAQLYYESMHTRNWPTPSTVPTGVAVFAEDVAIRRYAEQGNNIVHWSDFEDGGHFAAMEKPDLLVRDIRAFLAPLR